MNMGDVQRIEIFDKDTGESLGTISNRDLKFLIDRFKEQGMDNNDFYFSKVSFEMFLELFADEPEKPSPELISFLRGVLKSKSEVELHWNEEKASAESDTPLIKLPENFWLWYILLFSFVGGAIVLLFGFRSGIGDPLVRNMDARILVSASVMLPGILILIIYAGVIKDRILKTLFGRQKDTAQHGTYLSQQSDREMSDLSGNLIDDAEPTDNGKAK